MGTLHNQAGTHQTAVFKPGQPDPGKKEMCIRDRLCNKPYSGTDVIRDYGDEHLRTGALIVYTSADSVFQIAAHEDIVPPETCLLYTSR